MSSAKRWALCGDLDIRVERLDGARDVRTVEHASAAMRPFVDGGQVARGASEHTEGIIARKVEHMRAFTRKVADVLAHEDERDTHVRAQLREARDGLRALHEVLVRADDDMVGTIIAHHLGAHLAPSLHESLEIHAQLHEARCVRSDETHLAGIVEHMRQRSHETPLRLIFPTCDKNDL